MHWFMKDSAPVDFDPGPKVKYASSRSTDASAGFVLYERHEVSDNQCNAR